MQQIKCKNVAIGYSGKPSAENLNFTISNGDYLCIVGSNGAGKTTLIKTILGLTPALKGSISFINGFSKTDIGYLPQQTVVQKDFPATVWEVVLSGFQNRMKLRPFCTRAEKQRAKKVLYSLGIAELEKKCYRELSGGQQQRVLLARALCATKKMILLDEPVSSLDAESSAEMYKLIKQINREGVTVVMITHDLEFAMTKASHILFLGDEVFFGTRSEFNKSNLGEKYGHFIGGCHHE